MSWFPDDGFEVTDPLKSSDSWKTYTILPETIWIVTLKCFAINNFIETVLFHWIKNDVLLN